MNNLGLSETTEWEPCLVNAR